MGSRLTHVHTDTHYFQVAEEVVMCSPMYTAFCLHHCQEIRRLQQAIFESSVLFHGCTCMLLCQYHAICVSLAL